MQLVQITKETETGYEWGIGTDFDNCETMIAFLEYINADFITKNQYDVFAKISDVRKAEQEQEKERKELEEEMKNGY